MMGKFKKLYRKKQRNNKASKSQKKRHRNKSNKDAAASASVSEENKNYDGHDLETVSAFDDQTTPATKSCPSVDLKTMAALGISFVHSHKFRRYDGPPVLNSSDDPANWAALGNPYIH